MPHAPDPLAHFLTLHGYGTKLHGDAGGTVDRTRNRFGEPVLPPHAGLAAARRARMVQPPMTFAAAARSALLGAVEKTCEHRGWPLLALHVRTTHLHVVLRSGDAPERVMNDLKAYGTRRLRGDALVGPDRRVWSRHGSTKHLFDEDAVRRAVRYVILEQGRWLDPEPGWDAALLGEREVDAFLRSDTDRDAP